MRKHILFYSLIAANFALIAGVPQRWTVETSRVQPVVFDAVHGETLALEAEFKSYGTPLELTTNGWAMCWQTNGMGGAWWTAPATVASNRVSATFAPSMDPGAASVIGFLGATGENYRAAFQLRFRHGPGATPNVIEAPVPILDLARTVVINPPWPTTNDFNVATNAMTVELKGYIDEQIEVAGLVTPQSVTNIVTNVVTKAYVEDLGISGGSGCDTNAVSAIITNHVESGYLVRSSSGESGRYAPKGSIGVSFDNPSSFGSSYWGVDYARYAISSRSSEWSTNSVKLVSRIPGATMPYDSLYFKYAASRPDNKLIANIGGVVKTNAFVDDISSCVEDTAYTKKQSDERYAPTGTVATVNQLGSSVEAISAHLNAEDARFVSTNYDSVANMPEAYVEIKIDSTWRTIWKEMTRWGKFVGSAFDWDAWEGFHTWYTNVTAQLATKADRCWGIYDSETGEISPDGYTQISSSNILIAANMSYKRVVDTANAIWVLESNSGLATLGGTNGYFRVKDGDGNTQFEIIKGNLRELGCDAGGITVNNSGATPVLTITYSVVAASHPTLKICTDLTTADWKAESEATCAATVSWSGSSGAYVATVTAKSNSSAMFVKATYMGGSETIINNIAPTKVQHIYIGNQKYAVGYTTISGTGVMTLTPQ